MALSQRLGAFGPDDSDSADQQARVVAAKPEYELMAHNAVDDDSRTNASISISDGQLFLRSDRYVYCISE